MTKVLFLDGKVNYEAEQDFHKVYEDSESDDSVVLGVSPSPSQLVPPVIQVDSRPLCKHCKGTGFMLVRSAYMEVDRDACDYCNGQGVQ